MKSLSQSDMEKCKNSETIQGQLEHIEIKLQIEHSFV